MKTKKVICCALALAIATSLPTPIQANNNGWTFNDGTWNYTSDGKALTGWQEIDKNWYAFDETGKMKTGWTASDEKWYFMGESGVMQSDAWVNDLEGSKFFIKGTGVMATDYVKDGYELDSSGKAVFMTQTTSVELTEYMDINNKVIEGNLYIDTTKFKELELNGITITGKLVIMGKEEPDAKITIKDSIINTISSQTRGAEITLAGTTSVINIQIEENSAIKPAVDYKGEVEFIEVQSTVQKEVKIEVSANTVKSNTFAPVTVNAPIDNLSVNKKTELTVNDDIKNVTVNNTASDTTIEVSKNATINSLVSDTKVEIRGAGKVEDIKGEAIINDTKKPSRPSSGGADNVYASEIKFQNLVYALEITETYTPQITIIPGNTTGKQKWTSSAPAVATIDQNTGEITAVSSGDATITVEIDGVKAQMALKVVDDSKIIVRLYKDKKLTTLYKFLSSIAPVQFDYLDGYEIFSKGSSLGQMPLVKNQEWMVIESKDSKVAKGDLINYNQQLNGSIKLASVPTPIKDIKLSTSSNRPDGTKDQPLLAKGNETNEIKFSITPSFNVDIERYKGVSFVVKKEGASDASSDIQFIHKEDASNLKWDMVTSHSAMGLYEVTATLDTVPLTFYVSVGLAQTETPSFAISGLNKIQATFSQAVDEEVTITYNKKTYEAVKMDKEGKIFEITLENEADLKSTVYAFAKVGGKEASESKWIVWNKTIFIRGYNEGLEIVEEKVYSVNNGQDTPQIPQDEFNEVFAEASSIEIIVLSNSTSSSLTLEKPVEITKDTVVRSHKSRKIAKLYARFETVANLTFDNISIASTMGTNVVEILTSNVTLEFNNTEVTQETDEGIEINSITYYPVVLVQKGADNATINAVPYVGYDYVFSGYYVDSRKYIAIGSYAQNTVINFDHSACYEFYFGNGARCGVIDLNNIPDNLD